MVAVQSNIFVQHTNQGEWGVFGGNLPPNVMWASFDGLGDAIADAQATAEDLGVEYEGVRP